MIKLTAYNKNPNIGVVARANDSVAVLPKASPPSFSADIEEALGVEIIRTSISRTSLLGALIAMNNSGALVSQHALKEEIAPLKKKITVGIIKDKHTALGNLVIASDKGAVASKELGKKSLKIAQDTLDCEVVARDLGGFKTVGSIGIATNKGALMHPMLSEEELKFVEEVLKVSADVGTVNRGVGFVRTGIIANTRGVVVGSETTGPEIARIQDSLGVL